MPKVTWFLACIVFEFIPLTIISWSRYFLINFVVFTSTCRKNWLEYQMSKQNYIQKSDTTTRIYTGARTHHHTGTGCERFFKKKNKPNHISFIGPLFLFKFVFFCTYLFMLNISQDMEATRKTLFICGRMYVDRYMTLVHILFFFLPDWKLSFANRFERNLLMPQPYEIDLIIKTEITLDETHCKIIFFCAKFLLTYFLIALFSWTDTIYVIYCRSNAFGFLFSMMTMSKVEWSSYFFSKLLCSTWPKEVLNVDCI